MNADPPITPRRSCCGRWMSWTLYLTLVGFIAGVVWFLLTKPFEYRSVASLHVAIRLPGVLDEPPALSVTEYRSYIARVNAVLRSERVAMQAYEQALKSPSWASHGDVMTNDGARKFAQAIETRLRPHEQMIEMSLYDTNAEAARDGLNAVLQAFLSIQENDDTHVELNRLRKLDELVTVANNEIKVAENVIQTIRERFFAHDPELVRRMALEKIQLIEQHRVELASTHVSTPVDSDEAGTSHLKARMAALKKEIDAERAKVEEATKAVRAMDRMIPEIDAAASKRNRFIAKREQLSIESRLGGRVSLFYGATMPKSTDFGPRFFRRAARAGGLGAAIGFATMALFGFLAWTWSLLASFGRGRTA